MCTSINLSFLILRVLTILAHSSQSFAACVLDLASFKWALGNALIICRVLRIDYLLSCLEG